MRTRHALVGAVAGLIVVAGGSTALASAPPASSPPAAPVDCAAAAESVGTASGEVPPEFSTFVEVSDVAADSVINSAEPPFTVFVPVNAAFEAIPLNVLDSVLSDGPLVTAIVDYHVVTGVALTAADLAATPEVESALGPPLTFSTDGETLVINGGEATVLCPDITVEDGVVLHLIDTVLQPPAGSDGAGSSSVPGSSVPGSSVPAGFDADQQAVVTAWETVVDSSLSFDEQAPFIEDAEALRATIEAYPAAADVVGGITATVTSVEIDGDTATVLYTVSFAGVEAPYGELEGALIRVDGNWIVPQDEYCAVQAYARNNCPG